MHQPDRSIRHMDKLTVLVTGLAGGSVGNQILKAIRLSSLDLRIIGTDCSENCFGAPDVDQFFTLPSADDDRYFGELCSLIDRQKIQAIFPGSDLELSVLANHRADLDRMAVLLMAQPSSVIDICSDKAETMRLLSEKGFSVPWTLAVSSIDDLKEVRSYPVICKPNKGGGSANVFIAQQEDELKALTKYLLVTCESFLVQEYVGTTDQEYTVGVLSDLDGRLIDSISLRRSILSALSNRVRVKNMSGDSSFGEILAVSNGISQGEIGRYKPVTSVCIKVAEVIGSCGPLNIQCRIHKGSVYIFEINPRFSGTTSARALAGFNEPELLLRRHLLGESMKNVEYDEGLLLRGLNERFSRKHS